MALRAALKQSMPDADIHIEGVGDGVVLSGSAPAPPNPSMPSTSLRGWSARNKVVNGIAVRGRDQVMLKVPSQRFSATSSSSSASIFRQLQLRHCRGELQHQQSVLGHGSALSNHAFAWHAFTERLQRLCGHGARRRHPHSGRTEPDGDLRRDGNIRCRRRIPDPERFCPATRRSPPICQPQISFKKFGVSLVFTPVVLSEGRISLKVMTEVSDLSTENSMTLPVTDPAR